ncbi:hypothetical protein [Ornithinimicrobium sp. LYQ103]|uniref:hypothetical protein n=1 Tax=Ornithinimicrobium sp. LYQ103 TaxID=3378796 RepID=UPI0038551E51
MGTFMRRVRTKSGATAVQIVHKRGRRILSMDHVGAAQDEVERLLTYRAGVLLRAVTIWFAALGDTPRSQAHTRILAAAPWHLIGCTRVLALE